MTPIDAATPLPSPAGAALGPSRTRAAVAALLAWALCAFLYFETANGVRIKESDRHNAWHHYQYLVDGFLSGHLYVSLPPDPQLLALPDPYDPTANLPYRLWDASLYRGKYYLYYGPTPALLVMLPWKVLTHEHMPQRIATAIFAAGGLAALALLLHGFATRSGIRPVRIFWAIVFTGHVCWLPIVLRRPAFWELPIVAAVALFWWAVYFLWRYHSGERRLGWAFAAGTALAFALGARPTFLFTAAVVTLLFAWPFGGSVTWRQRFAGITTAALPLALGIVGLLWYNYARFGALFEFGQRFQLWGMEERTVSHFSLRYFPFNTWLYLFSIPEFSPYFPFVRTAWSNELPAGYIATEEMHGLLFAMPALLFGGFAFCRRFRTVRGIGPVLCAGSVATALAAGILFCFAGACARYVLELLAGWTVVAGLGFLAVLDSTIVRPRAARAIALGLTIWSLTYCWLASFEFRAFARLTAPDLYHALAHTLNYPSEWVARHAGQQFGPVALDVALADHPPTGETVLAAAGRHAELNQLVLVILDERTALLRFKTNDLKVLDTAAFALPANHRLQIWFAAPWLYPPAAHPFWDRIKDPAERRRDQFGYAVRTGSVQASALFTYMFDAMRFDPVVRTADKRGDSPAWVTHWEHAASPP